MRVSRYRFDLWDIEYYTGVAVLLIDWGIESTFHDKNSILSFESWIVWVITLYTNRNEWRLWMKMHSC